MDFVTTKTGKVSEGHKLGAGEVIVPEDEKSRAFVQAQIESGAAVHPPADGRLPPGATHLIVGKTADGLPMLQRARFSVF